MLISPGGYSYQHEKVTESKNRNHRRYMYSDPTCFSPFNKAMDVTKIKHIGGGKRMKTMEAILSRYCLPLLPLVGWDGIKGATFHLLIRFLFNLIMLLCTREKGLLGS